MFQKHIFDIEESKRPAFFPKVKISEGIPKFIDWYKKYYKVLLEFFNFTFIL